MIQLWHNLIATLSGPFLDNAAANAIGTIVGGLVLPVVYFAVGTKVLRRPNVNGLWILDTWVETTKYNPHRGMQVRYKLLLLEQDGRVTGTAEKIYERADTERWYVGKARDRVAIEGAIRKEYFARSKIFLHMVHAGEQRESSSVFELKCNRWGRRLCLDGTFSITASDSCGTALCIRVPLTQKVDEYRSLPICWTARLIEVLTSHMFEKDWRDLRERLSKVSTVAAALTRTYNLHLVTAALVLGEDARFFRHGGVDPIGILRALWKTTVCGKIEGASTIEQQLVRTLLADYRFSIGRKFKEIVLASRLHRVIEKDAILAAYLAVAHFGWGMDGVLRAVARLGIDAKDITVNDACELVARIKYPQPQKLGARRKEQIALRTEHIGKMIEKRPYLTL